MIGLAKVAGRALNVNAWLAAGVVGLVVTLASCDHKRIQRAEKRGGEAVVVTVNQQAKEQADAARKARAPARAPGAVERLRQRDHCRDC